MSLADLLALAGFVAFMWRPERLGWPCVLSGSAVVLMLLEGMAP